jgi:hypothetical protein
MELSRWADELEHLVSNLFSIEHRIGRCRNTEFINQQSLINLQFVSANQISLCIKAVRFPGNHHGEEGKRWECIEKRSSLLVAFLYVEPTGKLKLYGHYKGNRNAINYDG